MKDSDKKSIVICVGAQKSGTSWLFKCLEENEQICTASGKETNFFVSRDTKDISKYRSYYSGCRDQNIWFEASPLYLYDSTVPAKIINHFPEAKIIIILRDPIDRTFSHLRHLYSREYISRDLNIKDAIKKFPELINYSEYERHIVNYNKKFTAKNILIIDFKNIEENPQRVIDQVTNFIGIKNFSPSFLHTKYNSSAARANKLYYVFTRLYWRLQRNFLGRKIVEVFKIIGLNSKVLELLLSKTTKQTDNIHLEDREYVQRKLCGAVTFYKNIVKEHDHKVIGKKNIS